MIPSGKELLKQRKTRVEGIFALGKELHGLRRTRFMGRWKVQIQVWLTAAAINIKRAVKELGRTATVSNCYQISRFKGTFLNTLQRHHEFVLAFATLYSI